MFKLIWESIDEDMRSFIAFVIVIGTVVTMVTTVVGVTSVLEKYVDPKPDIALEKRVEALEMILKIQDERNR